MQFAVIQTKGHRQHTDNAGQGEHSLTLEIKSAVTGLGAVDGIHIACGKQGNQADAQKQYGKDQKGQIDTLTLLAPFADGFRAQFHAGR